MGNEALSKAQQAAAKEYPNLGKAYIGSAIDKRFKQLAGNTFPKFKYTGLFEFGPDVRNTITGQWWDLTTKGSWQKHLRKYRTRFGPWGTFLGY